MCLQRHIWMNCGCLDRKTSLPFHVRRFMCGYTEHAKIIAFPEKYNKSYCFSRVNMTSLKECKLIFEKLFNDLLCVRKVTQEYIKSKTENSCNCPEACDSFEFNTVYSLADWPSSGHGLDEAYRKIVLQKVIPYFNSNDTKVCTPIRCYSAHGNIRQNPLVAGNLIKYLANFKNKKEIMSNFLRLTVYIKQLDVETTQDVVGYSLVDLLSDIGKCY